MMVCLLEEMWYLSLYIFVILATIQLEEILGIY